MKRLIKKLIKKIAYSSCPELNILNKKIDWDSLTNVVYDSEIGKHTKLYSPYQIYSSTIGDYSYTAAHSYISITEIGKFCSIGPHLLCGYGIHPTDGLSTAPMFFSSWKQNGITLSKQNKIEEREKITIGNDVWIGSNVTILDGITIGDGAIIGAGAVVSKDIPPYAIAVGCPIRIIRYRFTTEQIDALLKIKWWDFDEEQLADVEKYFYEIDKFIEKYLSVDSKN